MDLSPFSQTAGAVLAAALAPYNRVTRRDAEILLAMCLGQTRTGILARPETAVSPATAKRFTALLERRAGGEPMAYLTGEKEFWSLPLRVTPDVLVPRPDTETVVEVALAAHAADAPCDVLDVGTGSGAIALALAEERPRWRITASDASEAALAIARDNARRLALERVEFLAGAWLQPVGGRSFDLIVSNPPYIAEGDPALVAPELRFEPRGALVAGATGREALSALIAQAPRHLREHGAVVLEHAYDQAAAVRNLLEAAGFSTIRSHRDLAGHERVTEARKTQKDPMNPLKGPVPP
jgi:release factor glutamine methyltransferase